MPRYKVLKGVAHNIGHSFTSVTNYVDNDFTLGHVLRFARETGLNVLTIDLLAATGQPSELLREPISNVPQWYGKMFRSMVASSGSDSALIKTATLTLRYDLTNTIPGPPPQNPYVCEISILDDRGKDHKARFADWWYVEMSRGFWYIEKTARRRWWKPTTWFHLS
jgi:hypothetical protein